MKNGLLLLLRCGVLGICGLLLFWRLGHYALWDDEALTALIGKGILATGDTSIYVGENVVAFRDGLMVRDGKDRITPPIPSYLAALCMRWFGEETWAVRLPFAIAGLGCVGLVLWWARRAPLLQQLILFTAILGNVSFFLYCRQARYYGLVLLLSVGISYLYERWKKGWKEPLGISLLFVALYGTHTLVFLGLATALAVDFLLFRRRPLSREEWLSLALPQVVFTGLLAMVWNPIGTDYAGYWKENSMIERVILMFWNIRDLNAAEFWVGGVMLAGLVWAFISGDRLLRRLFVVAGVYVAVVSVFSTQSVMMTTMADVRYLLPLIPLGWWMSVIVLGGLLKRWPVFALGAALVVHGSTFFHGGMFQPSGIRSTIAWYLMELREPIEEPYTPVAKWLREDVASGKTVVVFPAYMTYPLMYHASHVIYGWQLSAQNRRKYAHLPKIHFQMGEMPDYFVLYGAAGLSLLPALEKIPSEQGRYVLEKKFRVFGRDLYRPEIPLRSFFSVRNFSEDRDGIHVFKLNKD